MKIIWIQESLLSFVLIIFTIPMMNSSSDNPSIRIAAYDPKPPEKMLARRMGNEQGFIQDPVRPTRHVQESRNRRPLSPSRRRIRPQVPRLRSSPSVHLDGEDTERENNEEDSWPQLIILGPEELRNPLRGDENDSRPLVPAGPPVDTSTLRSALVGGINPPRPPAPPPLPPLGFGEIPSSLAEKPRPPAPPVFPPSPPPSPHENGPPTAPPVAMSPSPPPGTRISQVTDIKCFEFSDRQTFDAILTLPNEYEAIPVFQDRPEIDPTTDSYCRMIPTQLVGMFQLIVSNYEKCGVRKCRQSNGEMWHCLILRFPRINGLKLPEDEIIDIRCRPHDKVADSDIQVLRVATAKYADRNGILTNKPPTVFEGLQEFECEIGLFRQLPGTQQFNSRVRDEAPLELGEKVQLWSIVKDGDGWKYSRLSEVVIQKEDGNKERSSQNTVVLVFSDGCRNPKYKVIAEDHPFNDPNNRLVNKFTFRAFMFQDMEPGDSLLISAKVIGCISKESCEPAKCPDDGKLGYGKRRRRRETGDTKEFKFTTAMSAPISESSITTENPPNPYSKSHVRRENVTDWSRNLAIKIRMPHEPIQQKSVEFRDCKIYLFVSLGVSSFFCMLAIGFVSFFILRNRRKNLDTIPVPAPSSTESRRVRKPFHISASLSGSDTFYTSSDTSSNQSDLRKLPVPSTVRQRKRQVNAELMGLFGNENLMSYTSTYPPLLNYYGYMVVPRPQTNHQKKSLRAIKRNARVKSIPSFDYDSIEKQREHFENIKHQEPSCSCKEKYNDKGVLSDGESECHSSSHTSVIRITSSGSETISQGSFDTGQKPRPKPRPRITLADPIYMEIQENTPPTLV